MREPTTHPDALDRIGADLVRFVGLVLALVVLIALHGCGGAAGITGVAGALKTTLDVIRTTRGIICTSALDPIAGNPREGEPEWVPKPAPDAGTRDASTTADNDGGDR